MLPIDLIEWAKRLSTDELASALVQISSIQCTLAARLAEANGKTAPDSAGTLLTAPELARRLSLPESWVRTQARTGGIPTTRCGRYYRFDERAVRAALASVKP